jgi:xylulokinase
VGTQGVKALVYDTDTHAVVGRGAASYPLSHPRPRAAEQDPEDWLKARGAGIVSARGFCPRGVQHACDFALTQRALHPLAAHAPYTPQGAACAIADALAGLDVSRVVAVAVSGQQHGMVVVDAAGAVLRPAKLWCDTEASAEADALSAAMSFATPPGFTAPKLLWLKAHEPDMFAKTAHVLLPHDYVNFVLTGVACCEPSDASGTGVFDAAARRFNAAACAFVDARLLGDGGDTRGGGPGAMLPRLADSPEAFIGAVTPAAAARFGLPAGARVAVGGGDNAMAALGSGAVTPGRLVCSVGTSGCLFGRADGAALDASGCVAPFCDAAGGYLPLLCTQNCTGPAAEVRAAFGLSHADADAAAAAAIAARTAATEPLVFLPYLTGERTPNWPGATGAIVGLRPGSLNAGALYAAAVEGAALALRAGADAIAAAGGAPASELLLVGGAAVSPLWRATLADALRLPVRAAAEAEAAALGAALQAAAALAAASGEAVTVQSYVAAHAPFPRADVVLPDPARAAYCDAAFARFSGAGQALFGGTSKV